VKKRPTLPPRELGKRKWLILRAVVTDHVETAEPVGSEAIVERYGLGVKPATVRSEMAEMSEWGYLRQPYTSAGRVPSDVGYRYFVDRLGEPAPPNHAARAQIIRLRQSGEDVVELLQASCRLLARLSEYIAVARTLRNEAVYVHQAILSPVGSSRLLMVLVLTNGQVENRLLEAATETTLADLHQATQELNAFVVGRTLRELARDETEPPAGMRPAARELLLNATQELRAAARSLSRGRTLHDGVANLLTQPEFQRDLDSLQLILTHLDDESLLDKALDYVGPGGSAVVIGAESGSAAMSACSMVANPFYVAGSEAGVIGLLGPTRMRYAAAISLVRYTAQVLSDTLTKIFQG
jgi:heat-inducible transcriptional repressor